MLFSNMPPEIEAGLKMVHEACLLSAKIQQELTRSAMIKEDRSPVTIADFAVQALIARRLEQSYPEYLLVGEEDAGFLQQQDEEMRLGVTKYVQEFVDGADQQAVGEWIRRGSAVPGKRFWVVDPVDGTKGFLRGGQFAVALSLLIDYQVEVGILGCPNLKIRHFRKPGVIVYAAAGYGTWALPVDLSQDAVPIKVSGCTNFEEARLLLSFESAHTNEGTISKFLVESGIKTDPVRIDSQAKQSLLAAGDGEILLRIPPENDPGYKEKIWDQAAGAIVIQEAGGRVTDLEGKALDFSAGKKLENNTGVLSTNGLLHDRTLVLVKRLISDR
ncbi:MAG: hypothetical protein K8R77_01805 [Anaerolineaceae bacterium]|nr:hypothetical protein [Anaerolineaceae bacterium]